MFFYPIFLPEFFFLGCGFLVKRSGWRSLWLSIESFFLRRNESQYYAIIRWASNLAILRNCEEMRKRESEVKKNLLSSASQKASKWLFLAITDKNQRINFNSISIPHILWAIKAWFWVISEIISNKTGFWKFSTVINHTGIWWEI